MPISKSSMNGLNYDVIAEISPMINNHNGNFQLDLRAFSSPCLTQFLTLNTQLDIIKRSRTTVGTCLCLYSCFFVKRVQLLQPPINLGDRRSPVLIGFSLGATHAIQLY